MCLSCQNIVWIHLSVKLRNISKLNVLLGFVSSAVLWVYHALQVWPTDLLLFYWLIYWWVFNANFWCYSIIKFGYRELLYNEWYLQCNLFNISVNMKSSDASHYFICLSFEKRAAAAATAQVILLNFCCYWFRVWCWIELQLQVQKISLINYAFQLAIETYLRL